MPNHKEQFMNNNLEDGQMQFFNNLSENAIPRSRWARETAVHDTPKGAEASALSYTMVEMAQGSWPEHL